MRIAQFLIFIFLLSCANSTTEVRKTVVVLGSNSPTALSFEDNPQEFQDYQDFLAAGDSPRLLRVNVKELWAGPSADCSDIEAIRRLRGTAGEEVEIFSATNSEMISARPINYTVFRCIAVKVSDQIKFYPNEQAQTSFPGVCNTNTEYTVDIFTTGGFSDNPDFDNPGSFNRISSDATEQDVTLYFSVGGVSTKDNTFNMPEALNVDSPFDIYFYADYANRVVNSGGCSLSGFHIGLR
tara:strand:- start:1005 stop:1721 length:717 start_codon:yes stop_codon:yes gene_type:complete